MSIFYNTSEPTPNSKNTINNITVDFGIRDFLLLKKLTPRYPQISTNINGSPKIGEPVLDTMVNSGSNTVPDYSPIDTFGITFKNQNISTNTFKNQNNQNFLVNIDYVQDIKNQDYENAEWPQGIQQYPETANDDIEKYGIIGKTKIANYPLYSLSQNIYSENRGYLDENGDLNLGQTGGVEAANVIGSLLNGQGLGFSDTGLVTNFDLRSSLAGRALGLAGALNDTELGIIGAQQLAIALGNNAAFNVQEEILGSLNVGENILNLIKDGKAPAFRPNYQITVPSGKLARVADYTSRILGFTLPKSYLDDGGSIFQYESGSIDNVTRTNTMLLNTGRGQIKALISNVNSNLLGIDPQKIVDNPNLTAFRTGYAAGYTDNKGNKANDFVIYAYYNGDGTLINPLSSSDGIIPDINKKSINEYGFYGPDDVNLTTYKNRTINKSIFTWVTDSQDIQGRSPLASKPLNSIADESGTVPFAPTETAFPDEFNGSNLKKTLLRKTQKLFNSASMRNIVSVKGDTSVKDSTQISTANGNATSKGSAVLKKGQFTNYTFNSKGGEADDIFCRSWTNFSRYDSVDNLIRKNGLRENMPYRSGNFNPTLSVLDDNGFVKIGPYKEIEGKFENGQYARADVKKYMFSIENLAWSDNYSDLPAGEQGPGDSTTGKRGRIMWFPPYDITINENVSVDWEATKFIGRGESVYTYNNTERSGTLGFSIIVDHPTYANTFRDLPDDNYVASFFAGCSCPDDELIKKFLSLGEINEIVVKEAKSNAPVPQKEGDNNPINGEIFTVYFPNDTINMSSILYPVGNTGQSYESGLSGVTRINYTNNPTGNGAGIGPYNGDKLTSKTEWYDGTNFGLNGWQKPVSFNGNVYNSGFTDNNFIIDLFDYLKNKCKSCEIKIDGYASKHGTEESNNRLSNGRIDSIISWLSSYNGYVEIADRIKKGEAKIITDGGCNKKDLPDTKFCKIDRRAVVRIENNANLEADAKKDPVGATQTPILTPQETRRVSVSNKFYTELNFFEKLKRGVEENCDFSVDGDKFVFDTFNKKIKYFHPAFHSTTPEGLNSRLTFLQQCTRQGPTLEERGATNLAFGRSPVCILRVGDFYYSKIVIDSLSIDYEPLVWDLNPEGIGVQPMIAKVTLGFKFIGGSSLMGPINKLQNALSFNYYANTHVYDLRADYIEVKGFGVDGTIKNGEKSASGFTTTPINTEQQAQNNVGSGNQVNKADSATNGTANEQPTTTATTTTTIPKITSIKVAYWLEDQPTGYGDKNIEIILNQENVLTLTDDKYLEFINKGVKISVSEIGNTNNTKEEFIIGGFENDPNDTKNLFLDGRIIKYPIKEIYNGKSFIVTVTYNNEKIADTNLSAFSIKDNNVDLSNIIGTGIGKSPDYETARKIANSNAENDILKQAGLATITVGLKVISEDFTQNNDAVFTVTVKLKVDN
jgi:hypothetical protein